MSAQDRQAERLVADFYDEAVRPVDKHSGPRWPRIKRFIEGFASGYVAARIIRQALGR